MVTKAALAVSVAIRGVARAAAKAVRKAVVKAGHRVAAKVARKAAVAAVSRAAVSLILCRLRWASRMPGSIGVMAAAAVLPVRRVLTRRLADRPAADILARKAYRAVVHAADRQFLAMAAFCRCGQDEKMWREVLQ